MSNEVLDMKASITMLKRQLAARDARVAELEADAIVNKESYRLEVCTLRCDLIIAQTDLKRETADRMDLEAGFVTEDNFLTSRYSKAQKGVRVRETFFCLIGVYFHLLIVISTFICLTITHIFFSCCF